MRSATVSRLFAAGLAGLLLTACQGNGLLETEGEPPGEAAAAETPATEAAAADATPAAAPPPEPQVAAIPPPEPAPATKPAPVPGLNDDPEELIGMGTASLAAVLGAPAQIRRESPANIWQYRAEDCVLDVVLYPEKGIDRVNYVEARKNGLDKMPARTCLNQILRLRHGLPTG